MMTCIHDLREFVKERIIDLQGKHMTLIENDEPKLKMSVITGRILELKNIDSELELIEKKAVDSNKE